MKMRKTLIFSLLTLISLNILSCQDGNDTSDMPDNDLTVVKKASDLPLFELKGNVKECQKTTFYKVNIGDDGHITIDTAAGSKPVIFSFDKRHHYIKKEHESISRDSLGRIVRWSDSTPNAKGVHGGFLRDTLVYDYNNPYTMFITGRGEMVVSVRDSIGNIAGQTTTPNNGVQGVTSAHNVILETDSQGNWTRRLTVWTVQAPGKKARVFYMLDCRDIKYY